MLQGRKARGRGVERKHVKLRKVLFCSFCGKDSKSVKSLIQGPSAFICNECVAVCNKVLRGTRIPGFPGWDELSDEQLLGMLRSSWEAESTALKIQIDALRKRKVGWATIGKVLGVSRQAAWQRFK
jgi:ATP-dependent protease Clp ATPase subunit